MDKKLLEALFDRAFIRLYKAIEGCEGRLYVPNRTETNKISEQELKQLFIDTFLNCEQCENLSFSVETPTVYNYIFTKTDRSHPKPLKCSKDNSEGRRANIDVVILENKKRVAIIEFKANNPGLFEHGKDFIKLAEEPVESTKLLRYFVEVYTSTDKRTLKNIEKKIGPDNKYHTKDKNTIFLGYSLSHCSKKCVKLIFDEKEKCIKESKEKLCEQE